MCADHHQCSKENAEKKTASHNYPANKSWMKGSWGQRVLMTFAGEVALSLRKKWGGLDVGRIRHSWLVHPERRLESGWVSQRMGPQRLLRMRGLCVYVRCVRVSGGNECVVWVFVYGVSVCLLERVGWRMRKRLGKSSHGFWSRDGGLFPGVSWALEVFFLPRIYFSFFLVEILLEFPFCLSQWVLLTGKWKIPKWTTEESSKKSTGLKVRRPRFQHWLCHKPGLWPWVSNSFPCSQFPHL